MRKNFGSSESILSVFVESGHRKHVARHLHNHLGHLICNKTTVLNFLAFGKITSNFQLDVLGGRDWGIMRTSNERFA